MAETVVPSGARTRGVAANPDRLRQHAVRGLWAAGGLLLLVTALDLIVLWGFQRQSTLQWEFVASTNSLEGLPRAALGLGFAYAALAVGETSSVMLYRVVAVMAILIALVAAGLGLLVATDYLPMRANTAAGPATNLLASSTTKSVLLSGAHVALLLPAGLLGLRRS